jgi:tRNA-splicing ligase RtcB (3'-phosphate/5'-hydroxy nucleic acid ligase)
MNLSRLKQLDETAWTVPMRENEARASVRMYGTASLLRSMDETVVDQITNVARLPGIVGDAMTMPDAHWGYGFPIGGVAAFDPDLGGVVSAGGVGFDISCGIRSLRTDLTERDLLPFLGPLADRLFEVIPAGVGKEGDISLSTSQLDAVLVQGARWAVDRGYGEEEDLRWIEENGTAGGAMPEHVSQRAKDRQKREMGTLGSGNHYLEVQVVDAIWDQEAAEAYGLFPGQVVVSIHCGSRGLGHQIGTEYLVELAKAARRLGIDLPDRELACAPIRSPEGQRYLGAMRAGINCALANRQVLTGLTRDVVRDRFGSVSVETLFDVSHNTCKVERHWVDGEERELYVHRKGATRAFGPGHREIPERYRAVGQPVVIGGSMGTGSYILAGNREAEDLSFSSASHGAGRAMSRRQAAKHWQGRELIDQLRDEGVLIRTRSLKGAAEEAPGAYKDVHEVAVVTERAGLARRVAHVRPRICIKG